MRKSLLSLPWRLRNGLEGREGSPQGGQTGRDSEPLALTEHSQGAGQCSYTRNIRKRKWGAREKGGLGSLRVPCSTHTLHAPSIHETGVRIIFISQVENAGPASAAACSRSHSKQQQILHLNLVCLPHCPSGKQLPRFTQGAAGNCCLPPAAL